MYNTILFDLDGTLAPFLQDEFVRAYFQLLLRRLVPMGWDGDSLRQAFWDVFARELGTQALDLENILEDFYTRDFDGARSALREDADRSSLIRSLREKGYGLVLATNPIFPASAVRTRLGWVGLAASDFDYITTYENCRHSKPNPGYYEDILAQIGRQGGECLMVGNNPVDDMAAREAGMEVYLVTDYLENAGNLPLEGYPRGSFRELEALLNTLPRPR